MEHDRQPGLDDTELEKEGELSTSSVLEKLEARRQMLERSGVRHDLMMELGFHSSKKRVYLFPEVILRFNGQRKDAPTLRGRLVKMGEWEFSVYAHGGCWAMRRDRWELIFLAGGISQ